VIGRQAGIEDRGGHKQSLVCFPSPLLYARPPAGTSRETDRAATASTMLLRGAPPIRPQIQERRDRRVHCSSQVMCRLHRSVVRAMLRQKLHVAWA
jgi:hypothetical protein